MNDIEFAKDTINDIQSNLLMFNQVETRKDLLNMYNMVKDDLHILIDICESTNDNDTSDMIVFKRLYHMVKDCKNKEYVYDSLKEISKLPINTQRLLPIVIIESFLNNMNDIPSSQMKNIEEKLFG